ncbi:MAG: hypothetical protein AAF560_09025 [Acidobacteriota bacterium]
MSHRAVRSHREELLKERQPLADSGLSLRIREVDARLRQMIPQHRSEGAVTGCPGTRIGPVSDGPIEKLLSEAVRRVRNITFQLIEMSAVVGEELELVFREIPLSFESEGPKQVVDGTTDDRVREELIGVVARVRVKRLLELRGRGQMFPQQL